MTSASQTVAELRRDEQERGQNEERSEERGRQERERERGKERTGSPSSFPLVNHVSYPVLLLTFSTGRPSSIRSPFVGPSRFHSDLPRILHCEFPFHHPADPFLSEASEVSPSLLSVSLSFSLFFPPISRSRVYNFSPVPCRSPGPALRRPSLYSCIALFEDNRSDLPFFLFFFFLIVPRSQVHPRRAPINGDVDERPRGRALSRAPLFSSLFFTVSSDTVRLLRIHRALFPCTLS